MTALVVVLCCLSALCGGLGVFSWRDRAAKAREVGTGAPDAPTAMLPLVPPADGFASLGDEVLALREWASIQDRKLDELREVIPGVIKERDTWAKMYHEASRLYGGAQALMMGECERLARLANAARTRDQREVIVSKEARDMQVVLKTHDAACASVPIQEHAVPDLPTKPASFAAATTEARKA